MKKPALIVVLLACLTSFKGYSQDSTKVLLHFPAIHYLGLYVSPEFQYGQVKNEFTSFRGGSAMVLLNKKFALGITVQRARPISPAEISPLQIRSDFAGLKLEYTCRPEKALHLSFPLVIGMGSAQIDSAHHFEGRRFERPDSLERAHRAAERLNHNEYFIVQPGILLEANLLKYVKLYAGASYRFSVAERTPTLAAGTLQGLSLNAGLKIGLFEIPLQRKATAKNN